MPNVALNAVFGVFHHEAPKPIDNAICGFERRTNGFGRFVGVVGCVVVGTVVRAGGRLSFAWPSFMGGDDDGDGVFDDVGVGGFNGSTISRKLKTILFAS